MELGYVGLGKMGLNMVELLLEKDYHIVVYDKDKNALQKIHGAGAVPVESLKELASSLPPPRVIWIMVPYTVVDKVLGELTQHLQSGDTVIDGGNSPYKDSINRSAALERKGIDFLDVGVSGGPSGARTGACLMIGGEKDIFQKLESLFRDLSARDGYGYMGKSGAGHFVKMVHNGIEYGMMQAIAEGFSVLKTGPFSFNLKEITRIYNHRSVIESRLIGWLQKAFDQYGENLEPISGSVAQSGEGRWTVDAAKELRVPVPIIEGAVNFRTESQQTPSFTGQAVSAMRNQFGGHEVFRQKK